MAGKQNAIRSFRDINDDEGDADYEDNNGDGTEKYNVKNEERQTTASGCKAKRRRMARVEGGDHNPRCAKCVRAKRRCQKEVVGGACYTCKKYK